MEGFISFFKVFFLLYYQWFYPVTEVYLCLLLGNTHLHTLKVIIIRNDITFLGTRTSTGLTCNSVHSLFHCFSSGKRIHSYNDIWDYQGARYIFSPHIE